MNSRKYTRRLQPHFMSALTALLALGLTMWCAAPSPAGASSASSKAPFTIVAVIPVSGADAALGQLAEIGDNAVKNYLNARGGVLGHKIQLTTLNDASDPATAVSILQSYLSSNGKPDLVIPGLESAETAALLPIVNRDHILATGTNDASFTTQISEHAQADFRDYFDTQANANLTAGLLVSYPVAHHDKHIGVLEEDAPYFQGEATVMQQEAKKSSGTTLSVVSFSPTALSLTSEAAQLESDHVDSVVILAAGAAVGYALQALGQVGYHGQELGDIAGAQTPIAGLLPAADYANLRLENYKYSIYEPPAQRTKAVTTLVDAINSVHATPSGGITELAAFWSMILLVHQAAVQAGTVSEKGLVNALNHLKPQTTPLDVDAAGYVYTPNDHENQANQTSQLTFSPAGVLVDGFTKPSSSS